MSDRTMHQQHDAATPGTRRRRLAPRAAWALLALLAAALPLAAAPVAVAAPVAAAAPGTAPVAAAAPAAAAQYALIINADDSFTHNYNVTLALASLGQLGYAPRNTFVLAAGAPPVSASSAAAGAPAPWRHPATDSGLSQALAELRGRLRPGDLLLVYLTGHGYRMFGRTSLELRGGAITDHELMHRLGELPFGKLILIADQCYSGGFVKAAVALGRNVVAVSSADDRHEARCEPFVRPLWLAAVAAETDAKGNGFVTVEEAFAAAVTSLRRAGPSDHGDTPQIAASGSCAGHENGFSAAGSMRD